MATDPTKPTTDKASDKTTLAIRTTTHLRLKKVSALTEHDIIDLLDEAVPLLERKYARKIRAALAQFHPVSGVEPVAA